ncbi:MAG: quinolinate synthase NadA [Proteobacteria bacterium]|nr:quinolinate synthase NadA [Pseudomonadota bacterium]
MELVTSRDFLDYRDRSDDECHRLIKRAKASLGDDLVILGHHYQRADVYQHADLKGDSLKLSKLASQTNSEHIIFCGVHFMAEVADIMSKRNQKALLPDLAAGCSMADMANLSKVNRAWTEIKSVLGEDMSVTPVTYINSAADLKAFCGEHDGIVCTSSNASQIVTWGLGRREKILFFPDQHLGRWSGHQLGLINEIDMKVWDPDLWMGGLTEEEIKQAKILLWKGHCSVHQMFQPEHIVRFREKHPEGHVISHPECRFEVCEQSDFVGSTEYIVQTIAAAKPNTHWLVGTELNLVNRIAEEFRPEGKVVEFMSPLVCMCSTMNRIDPQHLAWQVENLLDGTLVNQICVPESDKDMARVALDRMLSIS